MDNKKDIFYKTKGLVESQKSDNLVESSTSNQKSDNVLDGDISINARVAELNSFLNKKVEKIVTALYMVTSFLSDNEPLKWKLRDSNVVLLSGINNVRNSSVSEVDNVFSDYSHMIDTIVSLLEVSSTSKLISEMNFAILKREYVSLKVIIDSKDNLKEKTGKVTFPSDFFAQEDISQSNIKDTQVYSSSSAERELSRDEIIKDKNKRQELLASMSLKINKRYDSVPLIHDKKKSTGLQKMTSYERNRMLLKKGSMRVDRKDTILKLFKNKKNKELTIKDISCDIFGCSEKTIQRELSALVLSGALNKKGERRWSRYSLK